MYYVGATVAFVLIRHGSDLDEQREYDPANRVERGVDRIHGMRAGNYRRLEQRQPGRPNCSASAISDNVP